MLAKKNLILLPPITDKWIGICMVLLSAFLFSAKAVLAKMVYREVPLPVSSLLTLRMLYSLPFYLAMLAWQWRMFRHKKERHPEGSFFPRALLLPTVLVGCLGYYISSFFDFGGLQYITAGLERVILFSYPTMVVLFGALFFGQAIFRHQVWALILSYAGIAIAFAADMQQQQSDNIWLGAGLILACAITFALYVLLSGRLIPAIGVGLFTSVAMLSATLAIFIHFWVAGGRIQNLQHLPTYIHGLLVLMAVFTTVIPSFLVSAGIKKIGSNNMAIISSIGPVITIGQAWYFLGEPFGLLQALGTLLVVLGVWWVSKRAVVAKA